MATASSLFLASPVSTAPRSRTPSSASPARPSPRIRRPSPAVAAAVQAEHQPAVAPAPKPPALPFRVGHGFDLHRLEPGLPLIIGASASPTTAAAKPTPTESPAADMWGRAHTSATVTAVQLQQRIPTRAGDVLLHCVVDAILGALGLPDIGQIFPDSDPKWKGADSSVFMREAVKLMHQAGYELGNLDTTLILQNQKLAHSRRQYDLTCVTYSGGSICCQSQGQNA